MKKYLVLACLLCGLLFLSYFIVDKFVYNHLDVSYHDIDDDLSSLQIGDLILRKGTDVDSQFICYVTKSNYSHIGIVTQTKPYIMVTHAITHTMNHDVATDGVVQTKISDFYSKENASKGLVLRLKFINSSNQNKLVNLINAHLQEEFKLAPTTSENKDENPLYCTVLIYNELKKIKPTFSLKWDTLDIPLMQGQYIFPQAFIDSKDTDTIYEF